MDFFCFHRDRPAAGPLRMRMVEEHWAYMDRFDGRFTLRGPMFDESGALTGSVHVVDVAGPAEARAFAFEEPTYRMGAHGGVLVRRWDDALGRSMWEYEGDRRGEFRLVLGYAPEPRAPGAAPRPDTDLVALGDLVSDDGQHLLGTVAVVSAAGVDTVRDGFERAGLVGVEVHGWAFGGRR